MVATVSILSCWLDYGCALLGVLSGPQCGDQVVVGTDLGQ